MPSACALSDVTDLRQTGGVEPLRGGRADAGQPLVRQRMQERDFIPGPDFIEGRRLRQFRGNLADELVAGDALADGDLQRLPDGRADGFGDVERWPGYRAQVEVAFVN